MRAWMRWIGYGALVVAGVLVLGVGVVYGVSESRIRKHYQVADPAVEVPAIPSAELLSRGEHILATRGCHDCHGADLGGRIFVEDPAIGTLYAGNLTRGAGGVAGHYSDAAWVVAIRNGVRHDGRPLLFMPSHEYNRLGDEDVAALVAYLKSLPPVDRVPEESRPGPLARALFLAGAFPLLPAELIDHQAPRDPAPEPGVTVAYGEYLAVTCTGCHGAGFSGGKIPGTPPDFLPPPNITPDPETGIGNWTEEDFVRLLRTGTRPDGSEVDRVAMPVAMTSSFTDEELSAIWMYLRSLPAKGYGGR
jgi:mono/diheme cytochrome c family protein